MDTVGADQHVTAVLATILEVQGNAVVRLLYPFGTFGELHVAQWEHLGQGREQVGAVDGQLRRAVFLFGGVGHLQARSLLAGVPHAADAMSRPGRRDTHGGANAQAIQRTDCVGGEVDIGTDAQKRLGLFEHGDLVTGAMQGDGGGQAADTGTGDSNIQGRHGRLLLKVWVCR